MAWSRGRDDVHRLFRQAPEKVTRVLRGAARAGATIIADEAQARCISAEVRSGIKVATRRSDDQVQGLVQVKGPGAYIAPWLEYGTAPHFISVAEEQRNGRSIGRINRLANEAGSSHSLVIGGNFVGPTVFHPGARPHPFLRVSLDIKESEAISAAQSYINARIGPNGIADVPEPSGDAL